MMKKGFFGLVVCLSMFAVFLCAGEASAQSCNNNADCPDTDGLYCTVPSCTVGVSTCQQTGGAAKCPGEVCNDDINQCVECSVDGDCGSGTPYCYIFECVECLDAGDCPNDGDFCTGEPTCTGNVCDESGDPCEATDQLCNETSNTCYDPPECESDEDCADDGLFCNGDPICDYVCTNTGNPCHGETPVCLEASDRCVECRTDDNCTVDAPFCIDNVCAACQEDTDCFDDIFCNGLEQCVAGACVEGSGDPCAFLGLLCDEEYTGCVECLTDDECADELYCNGDETCLEGACAAGTAVECAEGETCDEETDSCEAAPGCVDDDECDDGVFCNGAETCVAGECVEGPGDPCEEGETCDEENEECVASELCETDADCEDDGLFCNGIEVCVLSAPADNTPVEQGICASSGNPCEAGQICNEASNTCDVVGPDGTLQVSKCKVKAGKKDNSDSIQFSGLLDAKESDFTVGGDVVVIIEAEAVPDLNATTFVFPVDAGSIKKGKYKSPKDTTDPVASLQIDTNKGTVKFSAKKADLTGLGCPIIVNVEIGDYSAEQELGEDIVNGSKKPCPPELLE